MERQKDYKNLKSIMIYNYIMSIAPFWWRFWQCINKNYNSGMKVHLINAGKYFSKIVPPVIVIIFSGSNKISNQLFWLWCIFQVIATLYCTFWDFYMDWGLFRSKKKGTYGLRPKIKYNQYFYYTAMVINVLLRFFWVVTLFTLEIDDHLPNLFTKVSVLSFMSMMAEAMRRTMWSLIRVENEFHNNFEQYRSIPIIPKLMDDVDKTIKGR